MRCLILITILMLSSCLSSPYYRKGVDEKGYYNTEVIEKDGHTFLMSIAKYDQTDWKLKHNPKCTNHDWQQEIMRFIK